jgi:hypothetical protein
MNEELFRQQDARGRLIAHMFYSELEKIAKIRMVTNIGEMTIQDLRSSVGLLKKQVTQLKATPQAGWKAKIMGTEGHKATTGGIDAANKNLAELNAEVRRRVAAARVNLPSTNSEVRHQALEDLKQLETVRGGGAPPPGGKFPTNSPPPPKTTGGQQTQQQPPQQPPQQPGAGAVPPTLAHRVGQGTMAVGAAGALYGGYKMSKKPPADPYAQQYGQY